MDLGNKGTAEIAGVQFRYQLSRLSKKKLSPPTMKYLRVTVPHMGNDYSVTSLIRLEDIRTPEGFMNACRTLIKKILKNNETLLALLSKDFS